jgi:hypothetical protein
MKNIKTFEQFINDDASELNEAKKSPEIWKMVKEAQDNIQRAAVQLDNVRGFINDNYDLAEIKKMKSYQLLVDIAKDLGKTKDKLNNTNWPDEK